jgi:hypothetical protein
MHSEPLKVGAPSDDSAEFFTHLAQGLHAMAQPLTILRSIAAAFAAPELAEIERLRYLDISREQVERTCSLFEGLQDLVIAKRHKSNDTSFDLTHLVTALVTDLKSSREVPGAELNVNLPGKPVVLYGDAAWTRQAAGAVLKVGLSLSEPGDVSEVLLEDLGDSAELTVRNSKRRAMPLNSLHLLRLALAETNMRTQNGRYECIADPFCVRLLLPIRDAAFEGNARLQAVPPSRPHSTSIDSSDSNRF